MKPFQTWFYAATIYNAVWGVAVILFPEYLSSLVGLQLAPGALPLVQVIGMIVGVYAYGYYLLYRDPVRYCGLIWVGLAGKTFGPIGFLYGAATGSLPWSFGWVCVFNDLIWWPAFWSFALKYGRKPLG
ncbi:MAG: alkyl hydroperoxide reductase [Fimbriimonadales bacterium]